MVGWLKMKNPSYFPKKKFEARFNYIIPLLKHLDLHTILDVGCGNCTYTKKLKDFGYNVTSLDTFPKFDGVIKGDVTDMPFMTNSFDLVLCVGVLQILRYVQVKRAMHELQRVSKGLLLIDFENNDFILSKSDSWVYKWNRNTINSLTYDMDLISRRKFAINKIINYLLKITDYEILREFEVNLYGVKHGITRTVG